MTHPKPFPQWIPIALPATLVIAGWVSVLAVADSNMKNLKEQYQEHCQDQKAKEIKTDEKLTEILQALARVETKLDDPRIGRGAYPRRSSIVDTGR